MIFTEDIVDFQMINNNLVQIKKAYFNLNKIENCIKKISYKGQNLIKDKKVEYSKLPSMTKLFYQFIYQKKIPTPEELSDKYLELHFVNIDKTQSLLKTDKSIYNTDGIRARLFRTYPSLIRDFHFYTLCQTSNLFNKVEYSTSTDIGEGIDLKIIYKNHDFAISLFVDTNRSNAFKKQKYNRHDYSDLKEICIGINPFDRNKYIGDYALYNKTHLDFLIKEMETLIDEFIIPVL